jgi:hypothetical protein
MENEFRHKSKEHNCLNITTMCQTRNSILTSVSGSKVICAYTSSVSGSAYTTKMILTIK